MSDQVIIIPKHQEFVIQVIEHNEVMDESHYLGPMEITLKDPLENFEGDHLKSDEAFNDWMKKVGIKRED